MKDKVRIIELDGKISRSLYALTAPSLEAAKADKNGCITLLDSGGKEVSVNKRRIILQSDPNKAIVISNNGRHRAICPKCSYVEQLGLAQRDVVNCPEHGQFELVWQGECSTMQSDDEATDKAAKNKKAPHRPIVVDLKALSSLKNCELWTKTGVRFDHAKIDVQAHTLLWTGKEPRKLCFNTYDGTLGKTGKPLPIDDFVANKPQEDKQMWYLVNDIEVARQQLSKRGYQNKS